MSSELRTQIVAAPTGGYDSETADMLVPSNKARDLLNMLPGRNGKVVMRGGVGGHFAPDVILGSDTYNATVSGFWVFNDYILVSFLSGGVNYWRAIDIENMATLGVAVSAAATAMTGYRPTMGSVRAFNYVYGLAVPSPFDPHQRALPYGVWDQPTGALIHRWDGTAGPIATMVVQYNSTAAPAGARQIIYHLGRLWALGGSVPGTAAPVYKARLYYSMDVTTVALTNAIGGWQTAGSINQIVMDGGENDYIVGGAILNGRLVILRRESIWVMSGTSPENFQLRRVANVGCIDQQSILEWNDGIFFMSDTGLQFFDGAASSLVSGPITTELLSTISTNLVYGVTLTQLSTDFISVTANTDTQSKRRAWLYHVPTASWTRFTAGINVFDTVADRAPRFILRTSNYPYAWDGQTISDLKYLVNPNWQGNDVVGRDIKYFAGGGQGAIIPKVTTRNFKLAASELKSALTRLFADYVTIGEPNFTSGTLRWNVSIQDHRGVELATTTLDGDFPSAGNVLTVGQLIRRVKDIRAEVETVRLVLTLEGGAGGQGAQQADLHDLALEYQPAQWRT